MTVNNTHLSKVEMEAVPSCPTPKETTDHTYHTQALLARYFLALEQFQRTHHLSQLEVLTTKEAKAGTHQQDSSCKI